MSTRPPVHDPALHPGPAAPSQHRRVPLSRGMWLAIAMGILIAGGAVFVALGRTPDPGGEVARLDPTATPPAGDGLRSSVDAVGKPAPEVTLDRFGGGEPTTFAAFRGRPLVVNFFASWCVPCAKEMPAFEQVHREAADKVAFLGVDVTDGETPARELVERTGVTYDIVSDPDGDVVRRFGGVNMPVTAFIGPDGTVVGVHTGELSADELRAQLNQRFGV